MVRNSSFELGHPVKGQEGQKYSEWSLGLWPFGNDAAVLYELQKRPKVVIFSYYAFSLVSEGTKLLHCFFLETKLLKKPHEEVTFLISH